MHSFPVGSTELQPCLHNCSPRLKWILCILMNLSFKRGTHLHPEPEVSAGTCKKLKQRPSHKTEIRSSAGGGYGSFVLTIPEQPSVPPRPLCRLMSQIARVLLPRSGIPSFLRDLFLGSWVTAGKGFLATPMSWSYFTFWVPADAIWLEPWRETLKLDYSHPLLRIPSSTQPLKPKACWRPAGTGREKKIGTESELRCSRGVCGSRAGDRPVSSAPVRSWVRREGRGAGFGPGPASRCSRRRAGTLGPAEQERLPAGSGERVRAGVCERKGPRFSASRLRAPPPAGRGPGCVAPPLPAPRRRPALAAARPLSPNPTASRPQAASPPPGLAARHHGQSRFPLVKMAVRDRCNL